MRSSASLSPTRDSVFATALAIQIAFGLTAAVAGAVAATARKQRGRHPRAGRDYLSVLGGIFGASAVGAVK